MQIIPIAEQQTNHGNPYSRFMYTIESPETKKRYPQRFKTFLDYLKIPEVELEKRLIDFYEKAVKNPTWLQDSLIDFISFQKERVHREEIAAATISNYIKPVKLFCEMNNILLNWKLISRGIPRGRHASDDRAPTLEEIRLLLEYPDVRIRPIVLCMISSGIRIGSWDYLKWKHIIPVHDTEGFLIAAKVIVYAGEADQYFTFITSESYDAIKNWMTYRESYGEKTSSESWVMRDLWKTTNIASSSKSGSAVHPIRLKNEAIRTMLCRALHHQNIRKGLKEGQRRHEFKAAHGFRKYFKTKCEQVMRPANIEMLMGHDLGISKSYYKPTENELLDDYLKSVDLLTVNEENRLKRKINELNEKNNVNQYVISSKLMEREKEIKKLEEKSKESDDAYISLSDLVMKLIEEVQQLKMTKSQ